jgi:hypothetical protein
MGERTDSAAYGRYRYDHARELGAHGGARGRDTGAGMLRVAPRSRPSGPFSEPQPRNPGGRRFYPDRTPYDSDLRGYVSGPRFDRAYGEYPRPSRGEGGRGIRPPSARPRFVDREVDRYGGSRSGFGRFRGSGR